MSLLMLVGVACSWPASLMDAADLEELAEIPSVRLDGVRFEGNSVFSDAELEAVVAKYIGREIDATDLEQARQALTLHYVERGYINSGVLLPDQTITNGTVLFAVVEGRLSEVTVDGHRRLPAWFVRSRLLRWAKVPLSLPDLQQSLLLLRQNPNIERVNAELQPGATPGSSRLHLSITETSPWSGLVVVRNDRPPSIGAETLEFIGASANLTGLSDELSLRYAILSRSEEGVHFPGWDDWGLHYEVPVTPVDTTVHLFCERTDFSVIEEPFMDLAVSSESLSFGATVRHPVYRTLTREVAFGLTLERRSSRTFLLGEPFSISPGADEGRSAATILRFFQEWIERSHQQVLALRSTFSWGLDWFHPSKNAPEPDGLFFSWLGQAQYIRRLGQTQHQLVLNSTLQWVNDPLLALEQFSLGGANSVRGYRENQLVRDMGWLVGAELRLAVWYSGRGDPLLQVAPFIDYGLGWNAQGPTPSPPDLASVGVGLLFTPHRAISAKLYWGYPFRDFETSGNNLQDYGLHFRISALMR